jgi:hypothetical protein
VNASSRPSSVPPTIDSAPTCLVCGCLTDRSGLGHRTCPRCQRRFAAAATVRFVAGMRGAKVRATQWELREVAL